MMRRATCHDESHPHHGASICLSDLTPPAGRGVPPLISTHSNRRRRCRSRMKYQGGCPPSSSWSSSLQRVLLSVLVLCWVLLLIPPSQHTVDGFPSKRQMTNPFDGRKRVILHPHPPHHKDNDTNTTHLVNEDDNNNIGTNGTWRTTLPLWMGAAFALMALFLRAFHIW